MKYNIPMIFQTILIYCFFTLIASYFFNITLKLFLIGLIITVVGYFLGMIKGEIQ